MTVLGKRDVERLLATFDADPVGALTEALEIVLDRAGATFESLIEMAPIDPARRVALHARDALALDQLAAELNERREL